MRNVPKDNSKKNQKKKAGRKAKKIRHAENENVDLEDDLDEESTVIENGMGEDNESITVIDSNLAVFEIDD